MAAVLMLAVFLFGQTSAATGVSGYPRLNDRRAISYAQPMVINVDGDLKAQISAQTRDIIWKGKSPDQADWFAGDAGQSKISLTYNFSDPRKPTGECNINFVGANGNRPFAFMSSLNGAFPKLYLNQTSNIIVHFDINLQEFGCDSRSWLRTSVVVGLQSDRDGKRVFFEQDIQDNAKAAAALPLAGGDVAEAIYTNINRGIWVHLDVPFQSFMQAHSMHTFSRPFFSAADTTFLESVYLVNECFGSGHVQYSIANFWITVEKTPFN